MSAKPKVDDLIKLAEKMISTIRSDLAAVRKTADDLQKRSSDIEDIKARLTRIERQLRDRDVETVRHVTATHDAPLRMQ